MLLVVPFSTTATSVNLTHSLAVLAVTTSSRTSVSSTNLLSVKVRTVFANAFKSAVFGKIKQIVNPSKTVCGMTTSASAHKLVKIVTPLLQRMPIKLSVFKITAANGFLVTTSAFPTASTKSTLSALALATVNATNSSEHVSSAALLFTPQSTLAPKILLATTTNSTQLALLVAKIEPVMLARRSPAQQSTESASLLAKILVQTLQRAKITQLMLVFGQVLNASTTATCTVSKLQLEWPSLILVNSKLTTITTPTALARATPSQTVTSTLTITSAGSRHRYVQVTL
jgi:hypothetical protein